MSKNSESHPAPTTDQLLYTRRHVAALIDSSVATVKRLEDSGDLTPIKLNKNKSGMTYYRRADVLRLAKVDAAE